ncbi:MAG: hypothetical protein ACM34I_12755 [bacterium]
MGTVKSAFEKAMEKIQAIEGLSPGEKETFKDQEKIKSVLALFYKNELNRDKLWEKLKGINPSLLREAQHNMLDSLRMGSAPEEIRQRKDGILAIETLKETKNISEIESSLKSIEMLRKEYQEKKQQAIDQLRHAVEANPQLRVKQMRTPDGRAVPVAISVDEAVQQRLGEFLGEHDKRYEMMFAQVIEKLRKDLK